MMQLQGSFYTPEFPPGFPNPKDFWSSNESIPPDVLAWANENAPLFNTARRLSFSMQDMQDFNLQPDNLLQRSPQWSEEVARQSPVSPPPPFSRNAPGRNPINVKSRIPIPTFDPSIPSPQQVFEDNHSPAQVDGAAALPVVRQLRRPARPVYKPQPDRVTKRDMNKPGAYFPKPVPKTQPHTGARSKTLPRNVESARTVEDSATVQARYPTRSVVNSPSQVQDLTKTTVLNFNNAEITTRPLKVVKQTGKPQSRRKRRGNKM